jgi:Flp pilus assembly protein TadG
VAVELALVIPILVLLVFGIVEFGRGYNAKLELASAVREGVRAAALATDPATAATSAVTATVGAAPGLAVDATHQLNVTLLKPCPAAPLPTDNASVTATYPFTYDIPLFRTATVTLKATGVMRCGG